MAVVAPQATAIGRLLDQSTYGPTPALMDHVAQVGITAFLDEQLVAPESPWPPFSATLTDVVDAFFANAVNGQDQLRQRIIGALSEIFVIARSKNNTSSSEIIPWLSLLSRNAFGNYRTLLREITLDASMGKYLDLVNSGATGGAPNENYPRELMELFSLGVHVLNADGSPQVDGSGVPVPASQADVQNLARGLSGWTYGSAAGLAPTKTGNQKYYPGPMIPFIGKHDTSPKTLLGHALPANQTAEQDLDGALDIIFHHPNVGPFVATRLIRALVTSNPSADYITRVAGAFNGSSRPPRGGIPAVDGGRPPGSGGAHGCPASRLRPAPRADAAHGRALPSPRHQSGPDLEARRDVLRDERADPRRPDGLRALLAALPDP